MIGINVCRKGVSFITEHSMEEISTLISANSATAIHTVQITRNLYASYLHSRVINTRQSSTRDLEFEFSHSRSRVTFEFECSSIRVVSFSTQAR